MEATLGRSLRCVPAAVACTLVVWSVAAAQPPVTALTLKAAFVFNFAKFVDWPPDAPQSGPLTLCVLGDPAMADALEQTIDGQAINGRRVAVSRVTPGALGACHVLYLPGLESTRSRPLIDALKNAPVLTVGDGDEFAQNGGGIIGLFAEDGKMQLLSLAKVVKDEHEYP